MQKQGDRAGENQLDRSAFSTESLMVANVVRHPNCQAATGGMAASVQVTSFSSREIKEVTWAAAYMTMNDYCHYSPSVIHKYTCMYTHWLSYTTTLAPVLSDG